MPAPLPHRIRRLHWQARAPTVDDAFALRAELRELSGPALGVLEKSLSAHAPDDRVIHLPRLELHLRLNPPLSADALLARIGAAADEALRTLAAEAAGSAAARPPDTPARALLTPAPGEAEATSFPIDDALTLDTLLREAPAALHAAITTALSRATRRPDEAAGQGGEAPVVLEINGQTLRLPAPRLRELARLMARRQATSPASPLSADTPPPSATRSPAAGATPPGQPPAARLATPHAPDVPGPASSTASAANAQAQLATYLQSGSLDWTLAGLESDAVLQILRAAAMVWARLGALPACVLTLPLIARPGALARWLALLPQDSRQAVIESHRVAIAHRPDAFSAALRKHLASLTTASSEAIHAQALWLAWRMESGHATDEARAIWQRAMHAWIETLLAGGASPGHWGAVLDSLHVPGERAWQDHPEAPAPIPAPAIPQPGNAPEKEADARSNTPADILPTTANTTRHPGDFSVRHAPAAPSGLVVPSAGLVLLHPYLPRLLDATGLYPAGSKGPIADPVLPRAAALLHWLASGRNAVHEFELPFIKLLLGRAPDAPLSHAPPALNDSERDEATALLEAVLAHWQALRGTRVDGLRTGFLQRRGWIDQRDDAWLLRVEPESFDMLLGLLPWGLGLVRLPWMTQPLFTEWSAP